MAEEKQRGNLRATLALSQEEARTGTERIITLPEEQKVTLFIYPGAYNGQKIHLSGRGEYTTDGTRGDLITTLPTIRPKTTVRHSLPSPYYNLATATIYIHATLTPHDCIYTAACSHVADRWKPCLLYRHLCTL